MRTGLLVSFASLFLLAASSYGAEKFIIPKKAAEPEIEVVERIIKVEGTLERPRVIFILPRGKLWREDLSRRSFVEEMLEQVYPESVMENIFSNKPVRR